jgi:hypothetical protein
LATIPQHGGLNSGSPLANGVANYTNLVPSEDFLKRDEYLRRCRANGKRRATQNMERFIKCWSRRTVKVTTSGHKFRFKGLNQQIRIPQDLPMILGLDISSTVNEVYDISAGTRHHTPYACKANAVAIGSQLGIKLKGQYARGANRGSICQKLVQCGSIQTVPKAILSLI